MNDSIIFYRFNVEFGICFVVKLTKFKLSTNIYIYTHVYKSKKDAQQFPCRSHSEFHKIKVKKIIPNIHFRTRVQYNE